MGAVMKPLHVFKNTSEDWYGSFRLLHDDDKLVMVTFSPPEYPVNSDYVVGVSGTDDYSMVYRHEQEVVAWCVFLQVLGMDDVTVSELRALEFEFDL